jgi:uncharacterized protein
LKFRKKEPFLILEKNKPLILFMGIGSIVGALIGSYFLGMIPQQYLHLFLGIILLISAVKLFYKR